MPIENVLMQRLKMLHPVIQAPLAGGGDTPELVAAVGEAGALGFIGAAYLTPAQITEAARAVRLRTARPFGISLFAPRPAAATDDDDPTRDSGRPGRRYLIRGGSIMSMVVVEALRSHPPYRLAQGDKLPPFSPRSPARLVSPFF